MAGEEEEERRAPLEMSCGSWQRVGWLGLFKTINVSCPPTLVIKVSFIHENILTTTSRNLRPSRLSLPNCFKLTE